MAAVGLGFLTSRAAAEEVALLEADELLELKADAEESVLQSQKGLLAVGDEMERFEGAHKLARAAFRRGMLAATKDRKGGQDKKQKLVRQNLLETKQYRAERERVLVGYSAALDTVVRELERLVPLQSELVERALVAMLQDASARVQEAALYALAQVARRGNARTGVAVAETVSSPAAPVRAAAGLCLGEMGQGLEEAVDVLLAVLEGHWGSAISSDNKRAALDALSYMMRSRVEALTRLRNKVVAALASLQDGDASVREAAARLSGHIAREDSYGLEGFRCEVDVLYQRPPFLASSLVPYGVTSLDDDTRPPFTKASKRGAHPYSNMPAAKIPPSANSTGDRKQVPWPSQSMRMYRSTHVNTAVQAPGVSSGDVGGGRLPKPFANLCGLDRSATSLPPAKTVPVSQNNQATRNVNDKPVKK